MEVFYAHVPGAAVFAAMGLESGQVEGGGNSEPPWEGSFKQCCVDKETNWCVQHKIFGARGRVPGPDLTHTHTHSHTRTHVVLCQARGFLQAAVSTV